MSGMSVQTFPRCEDRVKTKSASDCNFYMGSCQNEGPFLGTLNSRCRVIMWTQKGTIILTTTHIHLILFRIVR